MIPPGTLRVVSKPVHPNADQQAIDRITAELAEQLRKRHEAAVSALATVAVPLHRTDMLGALHIVETVSNDTPALVEPGPSRAADLVTLSIEWPAPTLASFWPWWPGRGRDRIATLSELLG